MGHAVEAALSLSVQAGPGEVGPEVVRTKIRRLSGMHTIAPLPGSQFRPTGVATTALQVEARRCLPLISPSFLLHCVLLLLTVRPMMSKTPRGQSQRNPNVMPSTAGCPYSRSRHIAERYDVHAQDRQGRVDAGNVAEQKALEPQQSLGPARSSDASTSSAAVAAVSSSEGRQQARFALRTPGHQSPRAQAGSETSSFTSCSGGSLGARSITAASDTQHDGGTQASSA